MQLADSLRQSQLTEGGGRQPMSLWSKLLVGSDSRETGLGDVTAPILTPVNGGMNGASSQRDESFWMSHLYRHL